MLRFIFDDGNDRIEELELINDKVVNTLGADEGTIEGYFSIWKNAGRNRKIQTISDLNKIIKDKMRW